MYVKWHMEIAFGCDSVSSVSLREQSQVMYGHGLVGRSRAASMVQQERGAQDEDCEDNDDAVEKNAPQNLQPLPPDLSLDLFVGDSPVHGP